MQDYFDRCWCHFISSVCVSLHFLKLTFVTSKTTERRMLPPLQLEVEPVGRTFLIHYLQEVLYNSAHANDVKPVGQKNQKKSKKGKKKKGKKNKGKDIDIEVDWDCPVEDYYALLGIKKYQFVISQDNLKKACYVHNAHSPDHFCRRCKNCQITKSQASTVYHLQSTISILRHSNPCALPPSNRQTAKSLKQSIRIKHPLNDGKMLNSGMSPISM